MLKVLFEDDNLVAIYKPIGAVFESSEGDISLNAKVERLVDKKLFPVHRLDKVTSGLMIFAKSSEIASDLSSLFISSSIEKTYLAIAKSGPRKKQGRVKGDMEKSRRGTYKLLRTYENPAITDFKSHSLSDGLRLYILRPLTGKTHQLRVMMKSLGVPILGDKAYSGDDSDRVYLHSLNKKFELAGKHYDISSPFDIEGRLFIDFKDVISNLLNL